MGEKPLEWVGSTLRDVRGFPDDARRRTGFELHQVQLGLAPSDWKPMPVVGAGVAEIRIRTAVEHRVFYVARFDEAVYVLHAFEKKTQKTPKREIDLARARLATVLAERTVAAKLQKGGS
jgi:phage-related protein